MIDELKKAIELDNHDPLRHFKAHFEPHDEKVIYLDGNSLGRMPKETATYLDHVVRKEWGQQLIRSWNEGWYERSAKIGAKIARLIGAQKEEVIVADSTSVNLYKLAYSALQVQKGKSIILSDLFNFPSDLYILQGLITQLRQQHQLRLVTSRDQLSIEVDDLKSMMNKDVALASFSHVAFKSAFMYDMREVTKTIQSYGGIVLWDLSHSVGAVPIELNKCNVDMAVGCTYKYLNGGPGAPAFLYVRKDLQEKLVSPVWGWFGEENPFAFRLDYKADKGIKKFMTGTPPILSLSALDKSLDITIRAGMPNIRKKSVKQANYFMELTKKWLTPLGYHLGSPIKEQARGSHISLRHPEGYRICQALIDQKNLGKAVIPDFREPDIIRFGIAPLYTSYNDLYTAVSQLKEIVEKKIFEYYSNEREDVT